MRILNTWSKQKIFVIGFHKCGTTTLHRYFERNFIRSAHFRAGLAYVATVLSHNHTKGRPILHGIEQYSAFSDLCFYTQEAWIEANRYFPEYHAAYPDALFIFNDRPVDNWIRSRMNKPGFVDLACHYFRADPGAVEALWRRQYEEHREALLAYAPRMENFLHFDIERDSVEKLTRFVGRSFRVADRTYRIENNTATRQANREPTATNPQRPGRGQS